MNKVKVVFAPTEEKPYAVIWKPGNLPSAPLNEKDRNNALCQTGDIFPEIYKVQGRKTIEYGLLHRLDTATEGLLVVAATQECYDILQTEQREGRFIKYYSALCNIASNNSSQLEGFPEMKIVSPEDIETGKFSITSLFRGFGKGSKEVRPVTECSGRAAMKKLGKAKYYTTEVEIKEIINERLCSVECMIAEGYRHQVRCHLGWAGLPIVNDSIYNYKYRTSKDENLKLLEVKNDKKNAENNLKFSATKIKFYYPRGDLNSYEIALTWT